MGSADASEDPGVLPGAGRLGTEGLGFSELGRAGRAPLDPPQESFSESAPTASSKPCTGVSEIPWVSANATRLLGLRASGDGARQERKAGRSAGVRAGRGRGAWGGARATRTFEKSGGEAFW